MKALSIRQPWAWLIVNGHKDIENRCWKTHFRGPLLVHASQGMTRDEYALGAVLAEENGVALPAFGQLERGGIVGTVEIIDCVTHDPSPWFFGEFGFLLKAARPLPFVPLKGKLGFFQVDGVHVPTCLHVSIADLGFLYPNYTCQKCGKQFGEDHPASAVNA